MCTRLNFINGIIPSFIPNRIVVGAFSLMAVFSGHIKKATRLSHFNENTQLLEKADNAFFMAREYIENQNLWDKVKFGSHKKSNMAYSGCEIIATYNALISMGDIGTGITDLIRQFEKKGNALKGGFGIAPAYPAKYLKEKGYLVKRLTTRKKEKINAFGSVHETFLVTFYWDKADITKQLHTVNISKNNEKYFVHNVYHRDNNGSFSSLGPNESLSAAISALGERVTPMVIYGIDKREA